jgi:glutamate N-acetyltransferase / amino-acid N-acetyltransferase
MEESFEWIADGSPTSAPGFTAGTAACGIKYAGRDDLALLVADRPCVAAAVFTTNKVQAAPVLFDKELMAGNPSALRALVVNSGNANACTGTLGLEHARATAQRVAEVLGLPPNAVFVMSTGTIGVPMPMDRVLAGIPQAAAVLSSQGGAALARAIMTTDTRPKAAALRTGLPSGATLTLGGTAKGAGMIHPNMATLLSVVTTDAAIAQPALDAALRQAVDKSFNSISIDGDTSTNDTLLVLASGAAGNPTIDDILSPDGQAFLAALTAICTRLAHEVVRDGEGATRFVTINISGAASPADARLAAVSIARSPLVKTALFGADPNWGRVLCAIGYSGAHVDPDRVVLHFGGMKVLEGGLPLDFDEQAASDLLDASEVTIDADLGLGEASATFYTCDFSYDYVKINASYRT